MQKSKILTNFDVYADKMIEKRYTAIKNGKPVQCTSMSCNTCDLKADDTSCDVMLLKWLAEEYKEPKPTLTEKEMYLCKAFNSGYIARDENGSLFFYTSKPEKERLYGVMVKML